jgi:hypothetical protein
MPGSPVTGRARRGQDQHSNLKVKQMFLLAGGAGLMAASIVLLQLVRFREGRVGARSEWLEITYAILVTTGLSLGFVCLLAGVATMLGT